VLLLVGRLSGFGVSWRLERLRFGPLAALWLAVWPADWLVRTLVASASPRSRIVCNILGDLSRRERCLDKSPRMLRAAWIGVMQKNWIPQELPRSCGIATRWGATQRVESPLQFVQRVRCDSGAWAPGPVRPATHVGMSAYPPGTSNLDHELEPPQHTAPAGRTRADTRQLRCGPTRD
jgi:hypothetical protein